MASYPIGLAQPGPIQKQKTTDPRIESALEKLSYRELSKLSLKNWKQLASEIGLSYSRFHHLFKEKMGVPPGHFIKRARLCEAKRLLDQSRIPIKEVMFSVGFVDASHFCRDFKTLTGLSPTNYRKQRRVKKTSDST